MKSPEGLPLMLHGEGIADNLKKKLGGLLKSGVKKLGKKGKNLFKKGVRKAKAKTTASLKKLAKNTNLKKR